MSEEKRNRNISFKFRATPEEAEIINKRYELSECINKGAFFRNIIMTGVIVKLDFEEITNLTTALSRYNNNVNQIAHGMNRNGFIYRNEVAYIQKTQKEINEKLQEICRVLMDLKKG